MTDHILIDGWNVCWKIPEIAECIPHRLREARHKFKMLIKNVMTNKKITYQIIYDGQPDLAATDSAVKDSHIRFSRSPENADRLIISFLQKQQKPGTWTIVTSDRDLARKVKSLDAHVMSSNDFITYLQKHKNQQPNESDRNDPLLSRHEIEYWLQKFKNK
jgi:predicted RNA-binding protein with PIN domain